MYTFYTRKKKKKKQLDQKQLQSHWLRNILHSILLVGGVGVVFALTGYLLLGTTGLLFGLGLMLGTSLFMPRISPRYLLRWMGARPIQEWEAPRLYRVVDQLAEKAGLSALPHLYILPVFQPNAFAMGDKDAPYLGVTEGLLHRLNADEMEGVLAHEIAHIKNNDLKVMGLAEQLGRMTSMLSTFGLLALFLMFPVLLITGQSVSWALLLTLMFGPPATRLLLLALSRTREFEADRQAVALTGDISGLLSALTKIDREQRPWWQQLFFPQPKVREPSYLRTHPLTEERIERLRSLQREIQDEEEPEAELLVPFQVSQRRTPYGHGIPVQVRLTRSPGRRLFYF